jgi:hypothetical protein
MMRVLALWASVAVTACGQEPRHTAFFEMNAKERARVLGGCLKGATENGECAAAELAEARVRQTEKRARADRTLQQSIERDRARARSGR